MKLTLFLRFLTETLLLSLILSYLEPGDRFAVLLVRTERFLSRCRSIQICITELPERWQRAADLFSLCSTDVTAPSKWLGTFVKTTPSWFYKSSRLYPQCLSLKAANDKRKKLEFQKVCRNIIACLPRWIRGIQSASLALLEGYQYIQLFTSNCGAKLIYVWCLLYCAGSQRWTAFWDTNFKTSFVAGRKVNTL